MRTVKNKGKITQHAARMQTVVGSQRGEYCPVWSSTESPIAVVVSKVDGYKLS